MLDIQGTIKQLSEQIMGALFPKELNEGGSGSGNWGHRGIPGRRGGSMPRGSGGGGGESKSHTEAVKAGAGGKTSGIKAIAAKGQQARLNIASLKQSLLKAGAGVKSGSTKAGQTSREAIRTAETQPK